MTTIDRTEWITKRLSFLASLLETGVTDEQRSLIESEIETLRKEAEFSPRRFWLRRLIGLPPMPR